jgi:hypothetical protein
VGHWLQEHFSVSDFVTEELRIASIIGISLESRNENVDVERIIQITIKKKKQWKNGGKIIKKK